MDKRDDRKDQESMAQQQAYDDQDQIADLQAQVSDLQAQQTTQAAAPAAEAPAANDPIAEIKRLGDLNSAGLLTDEEFAAAKAKILGI